MLSDRVLAIALCFNRLPVDPFLSTHDHFRPAQCAEAAFWRRQEKLHLPGVGQGDAKPLSASFVQPYVRTSFGSTGNRPFTFAWQGVVTND